MNRNDQISMQEQLTQHENATTLPGDRVEFETLISDTSAALLRAPIDDVSSAIEGAIKRIRLFFRADRCGLLSVHEDQPFLRIDTVSYADGVPTVSADANLAELFPWTYHRVVVEVEPFVTRTSELPSEAAVDRASNEAMDIRTALAVPILTGSHVTHVMVLNATEDERDWPARYALRLRVLGEMMVAALQRQAVFRFETLISDTSAALLRATNDDVSSAIEGAVEQVRLFFRADRCALLSVHEDRPFLRIYAVSYADGVARVGTDIDLAELFPWTFHKVVVEREPFISRTGELPPEAAFDQANRTAMGTLSTLTVPVLTGGHVSHVVILHAVGHDREWPTNYVPRLRLLGEMMVAAVQRQTATGALRNSEAHVREESARLAAAVDAAELGFSRWRTLDTPTFLDTRMRDLLGIGPGDEARLLEIWLSRIDASARDLVQDCRRQVLAGEIDRAATEYRYAHPSRGPIWLRHVWRRLSKDSQGSDTGRLVGAAQDITEGRERLEALKAAHEEVKGLRDRLERENVYLRKEIAHASGGDLVSGRSAAVTSALRLAEQVAATDSTVLLIGETGTGKERFATFIHEASARRRNHMVRVNCSAIPSALIESELFGREKGAYTGALSRQIGRFELAQGSTLLLDEIGDLPVEVQVKLLRVLQERTLERLGSPVAVGVDVRIIAATNRDLEAAVRHGTFRTDLYYRLNVFPIRVPPLRERLEDLPLLVEQLIEELGRSMRKRFTSVERGSLEALAQYPWPGNVRELRNVLERAMILSPGPTLTVNPPHAPIVAHGGTMADGADDRDLTHLERDHILRVLDETGWRIRGKKAAAEVLGLKPTTLEARMVKLGIHRPGGRRP